MAETIHTKTRLDELEIGSMILVGDYVYYLAGSPERLNLRGRLHYLRAGAASIFGGTVQIPGDHSRYTRPRKKMGWCLYAGPSTKFEREDMYLRDVPLPVILLYPGAAK